MAINYATAFGKLGALIRDLQLVNTFRGTTMPARAVALEATLAATDPADATAYYNGLAGLQSGLTPYQANLQAVAQNVIIQAAAADSPQPDSTFPTAMKYVLAGMVSGSQTLQRNTVSVATAANGGNVGNPVVVATILGSNGLPLEYAFPEVLAGTCTADSQSGTGTVPRAPGVRGPAGDRDDDRPRLPRRIGQHDHRQVR